MTGRKVAEVAVAEPAVVLLLMGRRRSDGLQIGAKACVGDRNNPSNATLMTIIVRCCCDDLCVAI